VHIYWYWPFLRREELSLARGVLDAGDELLVHTTPRPSDPITSDIPGCAVVPALEAPSEAREGSPRWLASRGRTYVQRALVRDRTVRHGHFDVVHVVYPNRFTDPFTLGRLARRVPLVMSVHDVVPHHGRLPAPVERDLLRRLYRHPAAIVVAHDSLRRELVAGYGVPDAKVSVVPLQIIEADAPTGPPSTPDGRPVVLFFGAFRRNKGLDVLLEAIAMLGPDVEARFVIAGRGARDVEELVARGAAQDPRVTAEVGYATAVRKAELHAGAALLVLPYTTFSSQSMVLADAYAYGVPAIVSDVGALGETVREDRTGWVVEPGDAETLASAIRDALTDDVGRAAAAGAARAVAASRTPELIGRELRAVYDRAIAAWRP
jgi:glycosyltransferase involved in cell wall biosynthesis